ncbi:MAG: DUF3822 family protein [Bacteroidales bacterium]|jgi:hypothetical protein|nr:DUF3822 family protein [Bacteroidales bacterium]
MNEINIKSKNNIIEQDTVLSILNFQDGLCCNLWNEETNFFESLIYKNSFRGNLTAELEKTLFDNNLLRVAFKKTNVVIATNKATIVPRSIFSEDKIEQIYTSNFIFDSNVEKILYSELPKTKNIILYSIKKELYDFYLEKFSNCKFYSSSYSFIENSYIMNKISENRENSKIFLQVYQDYFEVLVIFKERILLFNTYKYKTDNDILYYIINIFEQLNLPQEEAEICISGIIEKTNMAIIMLKKFVKFVYFTPINNLFRYNYQFLDLQPHYFYYFLNLIKCE